MKKLAALILALCMVLSLAACGSSSGSGSASSGGTASSTGSASSGDGSGDAAEPVATNTSEPTYGGSMTMLYGDSLMQYFDPAMADNRTYGLWLESLWTIDWGAEDPDSYQSNYITYDKCEGQIADTWEIADDYSSITVTIRDDVFFQDKSVAGLGDYDIFGGRQLTAEDVAYSYRRLLGIDGVTATQNAEIPWEIQLPGIDRIEVQDDTTLTFYFTDPSEVTVNNFMVNTVNITGPEWDELTAEQMADWHYACGTGPYILTGFELDSSMDFVKSENYYDYDERYPENKLPYLDSVRLVQISDSSNIVTQFISGQLDYIGFHNDLISTSEMQQLRDTMGEGNYQEYQYNNTPVGIGLHSNQEPFNDINVRIAMQEAIDCETIATSYYGQSELVLPGLWASDLGWSADYSDEVLATYEYNPEDAKNRLAEAGYPDGFDMTLYIRSDSDQTLYQMAASYLAAVGINVTIETATDTSTLNAYALDNTNNYAFYTGCGGQYNVSQALGRVLPTGNEYGLFYDNPEFEELGAALNVATTMEERAEIGTQMDEIWMENHWAIYVGGCITLHDFFSSKIGGFTGERLCENNNTRTILARIWDSTAE